jgi:glycosyltransferase involved in cell wall biosynthesis
VAETPRRVPGSVTLFIPTLNEKAGMELIMPRVKREWVDQILVVDGNSTDGTADYARSLGYDVHVQRRPGARHAWIEGFEYVRGEYVLTFSPDGNSIPELVPDLIAKAREGYDLVIASRYLGGAHSDDDSPVTRFGNWLFTTLVNVLFRGHYTDAFVIFRIYRTDLMRELELDRDAGYWPEKLFRTVVGIDLLLSVRAAKRKLRISEIPGDEPPRLAGERKLQVIRWGAAHLLQLFWERVTP